MEIIEWSEFLKNGLSLNENKTISMTIGVFDGVHLGHKALIDKIVSQNTIPVVISFREPIHKSERAGFLIQSFEEKAGALESLGVQVLIVIDFTEEFSKIPGEKFLRILLNKTKIGYFAIGENFRCGYGLDTDANAILDFFFKKNITAEIIPDVLYDGIPVSSSRIRDALAEGDLDLAKKLIG